MTTELKREDKRLFFDFLMALDQSASISIHNTVVDWNDGAIPIGVISHKISTDYGKDHTYCRVLLVPKKDPRLDFVTFVVEIELLETRLEGAAGTLVASVMKSVEDISVYWAAKLDTIPALTVEEFREGLKDWETNLEKALTRSMMHLIPRHAGDA